MTRSKGPTIGQIRIAFLLTALGGLLFTLDLPLLRLSHADQWTMVFTRGIFLFAAISIAWVVTQLRHRVRQPYISGIPGAMVAVASTIGNMAYIGAVTHTNAANVVFIIALTPIIAATMSRLVLGERVHGFTWLATLISFLGVGIIAWDGIRGGHIDGDLMALMSAYCSALIFTIIRASGAKVATSLAVGSLTSAIIAFSFFGVTLASVLGPGEFGIPAWIWLALNGMIAIPLATVLLANGPRVLPSADVSMFFMLETVLTPVWIWLLFGEKPTPWVLVGGSIVIVTLLAHSVWRLNSSLQQKIA
jgi:drug/metabolite transporter (DMT)-like permease